MNVNNYLNSSVWGALETELLRWRRENRQTMFWWRDDDASVDAPRLAAMLTISGMHQIPLNCAVIPGALERPVARLLNESAHSCILQHGFDHISCTPDPLWKAEFSPQVTFDKLRNKIFRGERILAAEFGDRFMKVMVPPWNRIPDDQIPVLASRGYIGLSRHGHLSNKNEISGLIQINTHVDVTDWSSRRQKSSECLIEEIVIGLQTTFTTGECLGILTHHELMDDVDLTFISAMIHMTLSYGSRWLSAKELFSVD